MKFEIVYENEHFIVVDKPAGVLSVPSRMGVEDARPCLLSELMQQRNTKLWAVHRLDVEVSGLVLFAKNTEAHRAANAWFETRHIHKTYEAMTEGEATRGLGEPGSDLQWTSQLLRGKRRAYASPHGKQAHTRAQWLGEVAWGSGKAQSWRLMPLTGRPHQLRFELANRGFPILGDKLYGSSTEQEGIALRAVKLDFSGCVDASIYGLPNQISVRGLGA